MRAWTPTLGNPGKPVLEIGDCPGEIEDKKSGRSDAKGALELTARIAMRIR